MLADLGLALRALRRAPGFALAAVLCLALGIGAVTAVLAVADAVLFRPLPAPGLDRMVVVRQDAPALGVTDAQLGPPASEELLARRDLFDAGAAFETPSGNLAASDAEVVRVRMARTQGDFFGLMGAATSAGRFYPAEASRTADPPPVAVLGYRFWREHFGGDPSVVGRTVRLNGLPVEVVGVAAASLRYPRGVDLYLPAPADTARFAWGRWSMTTIARVRPGVTPERLSAGLAEQGERWRERFSGTGNFQDRGLVLRATPLAEYLAGELRPVTRVLLGAVALVLLVACANVACLQLVRATGRARELAVRAAVGAGRRHLVRPLAAESAVLAGAGGLLGVALAVGTVAALRRWPPAQYPQLADVRVDPRVLLASLCVTAFAALAFGLAPALRALRADPQDALRGAGRGASAGAERHRVLRGAVVTQVALALTLALGAGLLVRSFVRLTAADPGFRAEQVLTVRVPLTRAAYPEVEQRLAAFARIAERLRAAPGVTAVAVAMSLPFGGGMDSSPFSIVGRAPAPGGEQPHAEYNIVSEDYFRAMGIALKRGRAFTTADAAGAPPVVIVDEQLAREFFPGEDPVGRRIQQMENAEVVGVVASVARAQLGERRKATIYYPVRQRPYLTAMAVVVRGVLPPAPAERLVRAAVAEVDRQVPVHDVKPMRVRLDESVGGRRLAAWAMGGFAGVALLLAALGLYGVLSYVVAQRARELGVRSALGANAGELTRLVVGDGVRLAAAGTVAGFVLYAVGQRALGALLYGVEATDPVALITGVGALGGAALLASWLPARRAARVDPAVVLRAE